MQFFPQYHDSRANQGRDCVEFGSQHVGYFHHEDVAHHAATNPCQRGRIRPNHHVAGDPTRIAGGESQNQDSEQIESVLNAGGCAAQCEDESAAEIKRDQQCIHYDLFVDHQSAYGESHAWDATTIASTPVSNVG